MIDQLDPGAHTLEIIAGKCGAWDTTSIIFDIVSDISFLQNKSDLWVYPNPASDVLRIHLPTFIQHTQLSLIDSKGVAIDLSATQNGEISSIDCSIFPRGLYMLRITEEKTNYYLRVILK